MGDSDASVKYEAMMSFVDAGRNFRMLRPRRFLSPKHKPVALDFAVALGSSDRPTPQQNGVWRSSESSVYAH